MIENMIEYWAPTNNNSKKVMQLLKYPIKVEYGEKMVVRNIALIANQLHQMESEQGYTDS